MTPFTIVINYVVRGFVVLVGVVFLFADIIPQDQDPTLFRTMGVVFILFGVYRITMFYTQVKDYRARRRDDDNRRRGL